MQSVAIIEVVIAAVAVGLLVAVLSLFARALARRGRPLVAPALLDGALAASLVAVVLATLTPLSQLGTELGGSAEVNLRPLELMDGAPGVFAVVNLVLLVPTIVLLAQRWRRAGIVRLAVAGVAMSLTIELVQLTHPGRGTNVDDVLLNSAGVLVAAVVGVTIRRLRLPSRPPRAQPRQPSRSEPWVGSGRP
ncbi:MAG: VanZ family protein [Nitriliruptor sp.]|uniref:VanZ family protein n=1 Tax=Nitriliruptor sp. TaxID=2448056 RepID=UPI0034A0871F